MNDKDRIRVVTMIAIAWEQAGVAVRCEICDQSDWGLIAGADTDGAAITLSRGPIVDHTASFLVYGVHCKNCGNVRIMAKSRIEELASVGRGQDAA